MTLFAQNGMTDIIFNNKSFLKNELKTRGGMWNGTASALLKGVIILARVIPAFPMLAEIKAFNLILLVNPQASDQVNQFQNYIASNARP